MKLKLRNGHELESLGVHGGQFNYQGVQRDCLVFLLPEDSNLEDVKQLFTAENCKSVELHGADGVSVDIHENYTIRVGLGVAYKSVAISRASLAITHHTSEPDDEMCVYVMMAQSTAAEREINNQQEVLDALLLQSLEG